MISRKLLRLYFDAVIDLRRSPEARWHRIYENRSMVEDQIGEFLDSSNRAGLDPQLDIALNLGANLGQIGQRSLAIVTAWNPLGVEVSNEINQASNRRLFHDLCSRGYSYGSSLFDARGLDPSPNHNYQEIGFAFFEDDPLSAIDLGGRYRQLAIYKVTTSQLLVVSCLDGAIYTSADG
ncbi:MAG: DUF3293 domain-containing protein [Actinomycetota bacterium]|nr:DUF3293 domain-containing protein [Actinomycetota bacterium]